MKIERFEDIKVWREARKLVNIVYGLVKKNREFQKYIRHDDFEDLYQQAEITSTTMHQNQ